MSSSDTFNVSLEKNSHPVILLEHRISKSTEHASTVEQELTNTQFLINTLESIQGSKPGNALKKTLSTDHSSCKLEVQNLNQKVDIDPNSTASSNDRAHGH